MSNTVQSSGQIELTSTDGAYSSAGSGRSAAQIVNGLVNCVTLVVDETKPVTTGITYKLVYGSGADDFITIAPNTQTPVDKKMNSFYLVAEMTSDGTATPVLSAGDLDVIYIAFGDSVVINNSFEENARGFQNLSNTVHNETGEGSIELYYAGVSLGYINSGTVESTVRETPGDVWEVFLSVDEETLPGVTDIEYYLSTDGGVTWSSEPLAADTDSNDDSQWVLVKDLGTNMANGNRIALKAELKLLSDDHTHTPVLKSWSLQCRQTMTGNAYNVQLIDSPDNL